MVIRYVHALCGNSHQNILLRDSCFREADPTTWSITCVLAAFTPLYRPDIPLALRYLQHYHNMRPRQCQTCIPYFLHLPSHHSNAAPVPRHTGFGGSAELFGDGGEYRRDHPVQAYGFHGVEVCQRAYNKAGESDTIVFCIGPDCLQDRYFFALLTASGVWN
jgi:hypothetical protein